MHVDIGFLFLALIPAGFLLLIRRRSKVLFVGAAYWILWCVFAEGVIWYGFGGFVFLFLFMVDILHQPKEEGWSCVRVAANGAVVFWLLCAVCLRTADLPGSPLVSDPVGLSYAAGVIDEPEYMNRRFGASSKIVEIINSDIDSHPENPPKIYRVGTHMKYFIHRNDTLVLDDNQLDAFTLVSLDQDDQKTIARFKNAGFKYLLIDTHTPEIDRTPGGTLRAKYAALMGFVGRNPANLKEVVDARRNRIVFLELL